MKNIFFIITILLLSHKSYSSLFWICSNNYGSDFEYNILNKEVYIKNNNKWQLLYDNRTEKVYKKERIIYISYKTGENILYKEVFDLNNITIKLLSKNKNSNQNFELLSIKQCSLLQ